MVLFLTKQIELIVLNDENKVIYSFLMKNIIVQHLDYIHNTGIIWKGVGCIEYGSIRSIYICS